MPSEHAVSRTRYVASALYCGSTNSRTLWVLVRAFLQPLASPRWDPQRSGLGLPLILHAGVANHLARSAALGSYKQVALGSLPGWPFSRTLQGSPLLPWDGSLPAIELNPLWTAGNPVGTPRPAWWPQF